jgi:adenosine kinase
MSALVCGSFAFDTIMVFPDQFKNHILAEKVHILNVSFMVPDMRREFGGCAGNIAYNLHLLGGDVTPMGTVGKDFEPYAQWLDQCGIRRTHITEVADTYTAQAFITTDMDDNQITAFHPGAMSFAHQNTVSQANNISIGMVSPDGREAMIQHATQFAEAGIPFFFDPGQGMPMFSGDDLRQFIRQANYIIVNDYEWQLMQERTGWDVDAVTQRSEALIVTRGAQGSQIYTREHIYDIPNAKASAVKDPTGCGDAYRGGLLYGRMHGMDWQTSGRIGALLGALKIACHGTQNHHVSLDEFKDLFQQNFGYALG